MRFRDISKMTTANDGSRTLFESVMMPEVIKALSDWCEADGPGVLIGGVALSHYVKPRMTQDVDFLFASDGDIPSAVKGFKRIRAHGFQHNQTHVEVELVTPELISTPASIIETAIASANISDGVRVATPSALVALKLYRLNMRDKADIVDLIKVCPIDLSAYNLDKEKTKAYEDLAKIAETDT